VGQPLDRPAASIAALLSRDDGRAAHFYKTIAALSPAQAAFIAGPLSLSSGQRRLRLERLYNAFARTLTPRREGEWLLPCADAASVLFSIRVREDGRLDGPAWTEFWKRAFAPGSWTDIADLGELDDERTLGPADPGALSTSSELFIEAEHVTDIEGVGDGLGEVRLSQATLRAPLRVLEDALEPAQSNSAPGIIKVQCFFMSSPFWSCGHGPPSTRGPHRDQPLATGCTAS
jgi:hypothetical protein